MSRIAIFGEVLADCFEDGPVIGGAPFNVARHLAAFGMDPLMLSAVGSDALGASIREEFIRFGMRQDGLQQVALPTGIVDVEMLPDRSHTFHIRSGCAWDAIATEPALGALGASTESDWLYTGTLAFRTLESRSTGFALIEAHEGRLFVDLNWRDGHTPTDVALHVLGRADALKVNEEELAMVCRWLGMAGEAGLEDCAQFLSQRLNFQVLLVTCGAEGAQAFGADGARLARHPGTRVDRIVDTVGAGDGFAAVALAGLARGWAIPLILERATGFAARICQVRGAVLASVAEYPRY